MSPENADTRCHDLADLFKPLLADRVLFRLVNRQQISSSDFETELGSCLSKRERAKNIHKDV